MSSEGNTDACIKCGAEMHWVLPDTRLQAIADAPRCEHGNIYTHIRPSALRTTKWCDGAPKLAALLDALFTEEDSDE